MLFTQRGAKPPSDVVDYSGKLKPSGFQASFGRRLPFAFSSAPSQVLKLTAVVAALILIVCSWVKHRNSTHWPVAAVLSWPTGTRLWEAAPTHTRICFTFHPQHLSSSSCLKRMLKHLSAVLPEDPGSVSSTHMVVYSHPVLGDPMFSLGTCTHMRYRSSGKTFVNISKRNLAANSKCAFKKMTKQCLWSIVPDWLNFLYMSGKDSDITQTVVCPSNKAIKKIDFKRWKACVVFLLEVPI